MQANDAAADDEAEPAALIPIYRYIEAYESVEYVFALFIGESGTLIIDADLPDAFADRRMNGDQPARRRNAQRVGEQVEDDLANPFLFHGDLPLANMRRSEHPLV